MFRLNSDNVHFFEIDAIHIVTVMDTKELVPYTFKIVFGLVGNWGDMNTLMKYRLDSGHTITEYIRDVFDGKILIPKDLDIDDNEIVNISNSDNVVMIQEFNFEYLINLIKQLIEIQINNIGLNLKVYEFSIEVI
jgi:hypothetical protein